MKSPPTISGHLLADPRWQALRERLTPVEQLTRSPEGFHHQAAVLLPIVNLPTPELILTRRAVHLSSHAGEIAFPGGRWEPSDLDLMATALRESYEEIALPPHAVIPLGTLSPLSTRAGVRVMPVVGLIAEGLPLTPDPAELDAIFTVPVHFFSENNACRVDRFYRDGLRLEVPAFDYGGYHIWGLTAALACSLAKHCRQAGL